MVWQHLVCRKQISDGGTMMCKSYSISKITRSFPSASGPLSFLALLRSLPSSFLTAAEPFASFAPFWAFHLNSSTSICIGIVVWFVHRCYNTIAIFTVLLLYHTSPSPSPSLSLSCLIATVVTTVFILSHHHCHYCHCACYCCVAIVMGQVVVAAMIMVVVGPHMVVVTTIIKRPLSG